MSLHRLPRRLALTGALALGAVLGLTACGSGTPLSTSTEAPAPAGADGGTYTLKVTDPGNSGYLAVARKDGVLEEALDPLDATVEWVPAKGAVSANLPLFSTGELQVSGGAFSPVVGAGSADAPIRIGAVLHSDGSRDDSGIVAQEGISTIEDLVGKSIAINPAAKGEYIVLQALQRAGIDKSEVTLQYLQPAEGLAAFNAGKVDAVATFGDFFRQAKDTGTIIATEEDIDSVDTEIVLFTTDLIDERPDIAEAVVTALEPLVAEQSEDPDAYINVFTSSGPTALEGAALDWQREVYSRPSTLGFATEEDKQNLQALIDLFTESDVIEEGVTADDLIAELG
jgi:sulfonate transport system substrate-binding protein